ARWLGRDDGDERLVAVDAPRAGDRERDQRPVQHEAHDPRQAGLGARDLPGLKQRPTPFRDAPPLRRAAASPRCARPGNTLRPPRRTRSPARSRRLPLRVRGAGTWPRRGLRGAAPTSTAWPAASRARTPGRAAPAAWRPAARGTARRTRGPAVRPAA